MKFSLSTLVLAFLTITQVSASTLPVHAESTVCGPESSAVKFLRAWGNSDHFYTTSQPELIRAVRDLGYKYEGVAARVFPSQVPSSIPLYRLFSGRASDHFYTTNPTERIQAISQSGYADEGIAAYIYPDGRCGGTPLYRLWSGKAGDHFYTTDFNEMINAAANLGYTDEGIAGYVLPA